MKNQIFNTYKESILNYKKRHFNGRYDWQYDLYEATVLQWLHNYKTLVNDKEGLRELYSIAFDWFIGGQKQNAIY